ncbi:MAG TPA: MEDS domain-containing protein, partial [Myxococcota bacterium]
MTATAIKSRDQSRLASDPAHIVRFYDGDDELAHHVAAYLADGLACGMPVVVIATAEHRARFVSALRALGRDLARAPDVTLLDAQETLELLMVDGRPSRERVRSVLRPSVARTDGRRVCAYGEMVDVLWRAGRKEDALHLEQLWNELQADAEFTLLCAYGAVHDATGLGSVCAHHDTVAHESGQSPLLAEIAQRKLVERELRHSRMDLRVLTEDSAEFIENAAVAIHSVGADGIIRYANQAELNLVGYARDEYVGRRITDFHVDQDNIAAILRVLERGERLLQKSARLRCKDGTIKDVLITSNPHFVDGAFQSTRCFTHDVTDERRARARSEKLLRVTSALADAVNTEEVYRAVVDSTADVLEAVSAALWLVDDEARYARLVRGVGYQNDQLERFQSAPIESSGFPAVDCIREGRGIFLDSQAELLQRYPHLAQDVRSESDYSIACIPVIAGSKMLGSLGLTFAKPAMDADARGFVTLIARYAGQALERLRLLDVEQQVRRSAEQRAQRQALLSRASLVFGSAGPDVNATLQAVVDELLVDFAEGVALFFVDGKHQRLVAVADRDPEGASLGRRVDAARPLTLDDGLSGRVIKSGIAALESAPTPLANLPPDVDSRIIRFRPTS